MAYIHIGVALWLESCGWDQEMVGGRLNVTQCLITCRGDNVAGREKFLCCQPGCFLGVCTQGRRISRLKWSEKKEEFIENRNAVRAAGWLPDRESWCQARGHVCFSNPGREERSFTSQGAGDGTCWPADWLGKEGPYDALAGWLGALKALGRVRIGPHTFTSRRQEGVSQVAQGRGRGIAMRPVRWW